MFVRKSTTQKGANRRNVGGKEPDLDKVGQTLHVDVFDLCAGENGRCEAFGLGLAQLGKDEFASFGGEAFEVVEKHSAACHLLFDGRDFELSFDTFGTLYGRFPGKWHHTAYAVDSIDHVVVVVGIDATKFFEVESSGLETGAYAHRFPTPRRSPYHYDLVRFVREEVVQESLKSVFVPEESKVAGKGLGSEEGLGFRGCKWWWSQLGRFEGWWLRWWW